MAGCNIFFAALFISFVLIRTSNTMPKETNRWGLVPRESIGKPTGCQCPPIEKNTDTGKIFCGHAMKPIPGNSSNQCYPNARYFCRNGAVDGIVHVDCGTTAKCVQEDECKECKPIKKYKNECSFSIKR
ncbi:hypothetical protein Fcan01_26137 [Folsomia candida]|uniref:Secreted protein n=1 Tax=Folsomia candida TaxID=158441 RepID=A0A226D243_FOLCA|nr:hypothetical protein Fcan01_26137 [Folsomia candida]